MFSDIGRDRRLRARVLGFRVYRNCIGFGFGVLTESFDRNVLSGCRFLLLNFDSGGLGLGWAG